VIVASRSADFSKLEKAFSFATAIPVLSYG
jgi:hypothetical protein